MRRDLILTLLPLLLVLLPAPVRAQRFGLIARSGEALRLVRHDLELTITHPIAETVVTQEFENRAAVSLEAHFHYPVPPGATVTGLALWVGDTRREARMLERQKAREIYDGIVREKRDPALLERVDGGFRIRIFPVLPRSRTRVELRFVEPVAAVAPDRYRVILRRPPGEPIHVLRLGVRLSAGFPIAEASLHGLERQLLREGAGYRLPLGLTQRSFTRDLELRYRRADAPAPLAVATRHQGQELLVVELPLAADPSKKAPRRWALLVDGSRSMAQHLATARSLAARLIAELPAGDQVAVSSFDLLPREAILPRALDPAGRAEAGRRIEALHAEGGSAFLPSFTRAIAAGVDAIVCITDGATRYHQEEIEQLLRIAVDTPGVRIFVVLAAGGANEESFSDLGVSSGGRLERFDAATDAAALARRIAAPVAPELRLEGPLRVIHRDPFRVLIAGSLPLATAARPFRIRLRGGGVIDLGTALTAVPPSGVNPLGRFDLGDPIEAREAARALRGLVAASMIEALMRRVKTLGENPELRAQVIALSQAHNVVSEYTALLATETDADYQRPTSGQQWQRMTTRVGDDLPAPSFQSTPEPHEWAMIGIGLVLLLAMRRRQLSRARISARVE